MRDRIDISDYDYDLPPERIARFPLPERDSSKLLVCRPDAIEDRTFSDISEIIPAGSLLVFNNTKVVRARIIFFRETGARIEVFCLEPETPADYERAFAQKGRCRWHCMVGNLKKWKNASLSIPFTYNGTEDSLSATYAGGDGDNHIVEFSWAGDAAFGQVLEILGKMPIPPYLDRESEKIDDTRYQTVYSRVEGSVAAPTAGLHFTPRVLAALGSKGVDRAEITLHVGAGTFLPVKSGNATEHSMHTEHFDVDPDTLKAVAGRKITAVGTTSVRTLESLPVLGYRVLTGGDADPERAVGQWEAYDIPEKYSGEELIGELIRYMEKRSLRKLHSSTRIMITPAGFRFRVVSSIITNFHQPKSTLLLLVSAFTGERWRTVYRHALDNDYRFLSYGDSSILFRD